MRSALRLGRGHSSFPDAPVAERPYSRCAGTFQSAQVGFLSFPLPSFTQMKLTIDSEEKSEAEYPTLSRDAMNEAGEFSKIRKGNGCDSPHLPEKPAFG